jgi:hypothetical protein
MDSKLLCTSGTPREHQLRQDCRKVLETLMSFQPVIRREGVKTLCHFRSKGLPPIWSRSTSVDFSWSIDARGEITLSLQEQRAPSAKEKKCICDTYLGAQPHDMSVCTLQDLRRVLPDQTATNSSWTSIGFSTLSSNGSIKRIIEYARGSKMSLSTYVLWLRQTGSYSSRLRIKDAGLREIPECPDFGKVPGRHLDSGMGASVKKGLTE